MQTLKSPQRNKTINNMKFQKLNKKTCDNNNYTAHSLSISLSAGIEYLLLVLVVPSVSVV